MENRGILAESGHSTSEHLCACLRWLVFALLINLRFILCIGAVADLD